jgi:predicted MFS family arabinose efflux permease
VSASPVVGRDTRLARLTVYGHFFLLGVVLAIWVSRIPTVKARLGLTDGSLSLALLALPTGAIIALQLVGRLTDRFGSARTATVGGTLSGLTLIGPGLAGSLPALIGAMLLAGATQGVFDVGINAQAVRVERAHGRPLMSSFHAAFSFGGLAGASLGGLAAHAGISPATTFLAAGLPIAAFVLGCSRLLLPAERGPVAQVVPVDPTAGAAVAGEIPAVRTEPGRTVSPGLIALLGLLGIFCLLGEGAAGDWSAVYLRDHLGASVGFAPTAFAAFSIAMAVGRLAGDRLTARFGPVRLVRCCGLLAAAGLGGALLAGSPWVATIGFGVFGAGLSSIVPQIFSAAGNADPARAGANLARVASLGYLGLVGGPVLIGGVARFVGLPLALVIPVLLAGFVSAAAGVLRPPRAEKNQQDAPSPAVPESEPNR